MHDKLDIGHVFLYNKYNSSKPFLIPYDCTTVDNNNVTMSINPLISLFIVRNLEYDNSTSYDLKL